MIGYFPDPHPGELFYSVCARFAVRMRIPTAAGTMRMLSGRRHAIAVPDLPHDLDMFASQLPPGHPLTADLIIHQHTLLPYCSAFLEPTTSTLLEANLHAPGYGNDHLRTGICASRIRPPEFFRSCPRCDAGNVANFDETYWHRLFQIAGVEVCPKHRVFLVASTARLKSPANRHQFVAATPGGSSATPIDPGNPQHVILLTIAEDVAWLLDQRPAGCELEHTCRRYLELLRERNYVGRGKMIDVERLRRDLIIFFTPPLLETLQSPLPAEGSLGWLGRLVRKPKGSAPPLRHLLLLAFLGVRPAEFVHPTPKIEPANRRQPPRGPWLCLNLICQHHRQPVIETFTTKYSNSRKADIARFECPHCGFSYGLWDWSNAVTETSVVYERGPLWHRRLREYWNDPTLGICEMSHRLGVDPTTTKKQAVRLGLPFPRIAKRITTDEGLRKRQEKDRTPQREADRASWLALRDQHHDLGRSALGKISYGLAVRLRRHDRAWWEAHLPQRIKVQQPARRAGWATRDEELSALVVNAAFRVKQREARPVRVTRTAIGKQLGCQTLISQHLDKLPLTAAMLRNVVESVAEFAVRRVRRAAARLRRGEWPVARWRLVKASGLRKDIERLPAVQLALDYELSFHVVAPAIQTDPAEDACRND